VLLKRLSDSTGEIQTLLFLQWAHSCYWQIILGIL